MSGREASGKCDALQAGAGGSKSDALITFDESDFPSLGGGPARPAGVMPDGGTANPGGGSSAGPSPITAASATLGPDPYVALSLGKGQEFNMQARFRTASGPSRRLDNDLRIASGSCLHAQLAGVPKIAPVPLASCSCVTDPLTVTHLHQLCS
jgi:hypothetical protein